MARNKTPEAIAAMLQSQHAAEDAMAAVIEYLRTSSSPNSEEAHRIIDRVLAEHDCESPDGHIVAGGLQAVEPHERGTGAIRRGEAIVIDIFPKSKKHGYFADMTHTVSLGEPAPEIRKMFDAVVAAQEVAFAMIRPDVNTKSIQDAVEKHFVDLGYQTSGKGTLFAFADGFVHGLGHGVGIDVHEKPHISRKSEDVLMEGDVVTIEPGLYYHDIGGIRMEDMVLVTADGYRNLTKSPKEFIL